MLSTLCSAAPRSGGSVVHTGLYSSPKGLGATVSIHTPYDMIHSFSLLADLGGVATGQIKSPGWKFLWDVNHVLASGALKEEPLDFYLYAGYGLSMGHVRDFNRNDGMGWMAALNMDGGLALSFERRVTVCMEFNLEYGFILTGGGAVLSTEPTGRSLGFYRNGIFRGYIPQIKVLYNL